MAYKLAVQDKVHVPINFNMADGTAIKNFNFTLICDRVTAEEWDASIRDSNGITQDSKIREKFLAITTDWKNQKFVLDDSGEPAAFCQDAFAVLLDTPNMLEIVIRSFLKENGAKAKN